MEKFILDTTTIFNSGEVFALRKRLYKHEPGTVKNTGHSFCIWVADLFIRYFACQFYLSLSRNSCTDDLATYRGNPQIRISRGFYLDADVAPEVYELE